MSRAECTKGTRRRGVHETPCFTLKVIAMAEAVLFASPRGPLGDPAEGSSRPSTILRPGVSDFTVATTTSCSTMAEPIADVARRRRVSFHNARIFHEAADADEMNACRRDVWYQHTELQQMKRKAVQLSKEAHRLGLGALLTNTYGKSENKDSQDALNTWVCCNSHSRRGLERWINDEYAAKRSDIRRRTITSVIRAQSKMREEGIDDVDYSVKVLARLSEAFSVDSRNFARSMGVADEKAATADSSQERQAKETSKALARTYSPKSVVEQSPKYPTRRPIRVPPSSSGRVSPPGGSDYRHFY